MSEYKDDSNGLITRKLPEKLGESYSKAVKQTYSNYVDSEMYNASEMLKQREKDRQRALEKLKKMQEAAAVHARQQAQGATDITDEQLKEYYINILTEQDDAKARVLRTLEERVKQLEKALKEAGTRDPLLVATNEVLAEENKRLTSELERLLDEQADLRRRLDEAHNRLYKTIDILQEHASGRSNIDSAPVQGAQSQEAQEGSREDNVREGGGAEPPAGGSEYNAAGGQREAAQAGEGPRGAGARTLSVVVGTRS